MLHDLGAAVGSPSALIQVLDTLPAAAYTCDPEGRITYFNRGAVEVWGRTPRLNDEAERFCGSHKLFFADGRPMRRDESAMARAIRDRSAYNGQEIQVQRPDGGLRYVLAHANPMFDDDGGLLGASNILVNITDRKRFEERLIYQATHDPLTGLPNRTLFLRALNQAITEAEVKGRPFALVLLDLDRFKSVNDTFGHEYGDEILRQIRPRLVDAVGDGGLVARMGGDEFALLLRGADAARATRAAKAVLGALVAPIVIDGRAFDVGASLGVALQPDHGRDSATLLRRADVAMYAAKREQSGFEIYADHQQATTPQQISMIAELRRAIESEGLALFYQPKVDLTTLEVMGVEALVRWPHPQRGLIPPGDFLPLAQANGLSRRLDLWAFREALRQGRQWRRQGIDLDVAVNLFPESLLDVEFVDAAMRMLDESGGPPHNLSIELTERAVVSDPARAQAALDRFRCRGVKAALDDFGTGYSSLTHLKMLRVDEMKLDLTFVRGLPDSHVDASISEAVVRMGLSLGLTVTAEGVETREALEWLTERGCTQAQGYYFSKPLPPAELEAWLASPWRILSLAGPPPPRPDDDVRPDDWAAWAEGVAAAPLE